MPNPRTQVAGRPHLERDRQQWIFDYIVQQTGRVFHWWPDDRGDLPRSVRSHAMIAKHLGREGQRLEAESDAEAAAGHREKALALAYLATRAFMDAQHTIFVVNEEKRFLNVGLQRCFDKVIERCSYTIERVRIPWQNTTLSGYLHLCPGKEVAPLVFSMPGCDMTCEGWPNPVHNPVHERGMHVFSMDGPGIGQSNIEGIRLTDDNYEQATSAALDYLVNRPEIDASKIVTYGTGMGSFWAIRAVAHDHRFQAAATKNSYADKYYLMNEDGPRWKQLFAFLTMSSSEDELDAIVQKMTLDGYMEKITCPTLMITGEYDLRDPIEEVFAIFDQLKAPAELWVYADQFHRLIVEDGPEVLDLMLDWLRDRVEAKPLTRAGEVIYVEPGGPDPTNPSVEHKRRWYETSS